MNLMIAIVNFSIDELMNLNYDSYPKISVYIPDIIFINHQLELIILVNTL